VTKIRADRVRGDRSEQAEVGGVTRIRLRNPSPRRRFVTILTGGFQGDTAFQNVLPLPNKTKLINVRQITAKP
jgi:hypothetical protein